MKEPVTAVSAESQHAAQPKLPLYTCTRAISARLNLRNDAVVVNPVNPGLRPNGKPRLPPDRVPAESKRSEEHTSELQSPCNLVCRLLLEKKKKKNEVHTYMYTT